MSENEEKFWTYEIDLIISAGPATAWNTDEKIAEKLCDGFAMLTPKQAEEIVRVFWGNPNRTRG